MGREVEQMALATGHEVSFRLDSAEEWEKAGALLRQADVVIDFSLPGAVADNIRRAIDLELPMVTGTTGWYDQLPAIRQLCEERSAALLVAANFTIGVNLMIELSSRLSAILNRFPQYTISIEEIHHIHKMDSPSGTAIRIAEEVIGNSKRKKNWSPGISADPSVLQVTSKREGEEAGTHILRAESQYDTLEIIHRAKGRAGFAAGALVAADWIIGRQGFFTMKDLLVWTD